MITLHEIPAPFGLAAENGTLTNGRQRPYRVVVHGLRFFCQKLPGLVGDEQWDIRDRSQHTPGQLVRLVQDLRTCDLVFTWAGRIDMGRFLWGAKLLCARKIVMFWCGSDVLRAQKYFAAGRMDPWIAERIHWAASPSLAEEVRAMGLRCEYVQASFVEPVARTTPLPREFSVLVFMPRADRAELYGWDHVGEVARALPAMKFTVVGLLWGQNIEAPPNVTVHYRTNGLDWAYEQSTVLWRPVRHDAGISFMVIEALAHGRHVLYTYPVPGAVQVSGPAQAKEQLEHLQARHNSGALELNRAGIESVARIYSRDVVRKELRRRWEEIILS